MPAEITTITPGEARKRGLQALTVPYRLPSQQAMMEAVCADLDVPGIRWALVRKNPTATRVEVWRSGMNSLINAARERGEL